MKVAVILASGIGNSILFGPTLQAIRKSHPEWTIDILALNEKFAEPFRNSELVNTVRKVPFHHGKILFFLLKCRGKYDVSITAFPSNRWEFNLFAFLLGTRIRMTHSYQHGALRTLNFLQNKKVPAVPGLHDVEQNLNLLDPLGIPKPKGTPPLLYSLAEEDELAAHNLLKKCRINDDDYVYGVHAGSGASIKKKQWPIQNFRDTVLKDINKKRNTAILLFGGEEEAEQKEQLRAMLVAKNPDLEKKIHLINAPLGVSAALISRCDYFLSNDTGLMHIAAAFSVPQTGVFVATNPSRTRPWNSKAQILDQTNGKAYLYPFWSVKAQG